LQSGTRKSHSLLVRLPHVADGSSAIQYLDI
jgi:hypothetical protein